MNIVPDDVREKLERRTVAELREMMKKINDMHGGHGNIPLSSDFWLIRRIVLEKESRASA